MGTANIGIKDVLSYLLEQSKITESHLAKALNLPRASINKIHSGKILDPRTSTLNLIANYFGVTLDQLVGKSPLINESAIKFIQVPVVDQDDLKNYPQTAYTMNFASHKNLVLVEYDSINHNDNLKLIATKIISDAMLPYFDEKTTAIIDINAQATNRKYVLVYIAATNEVLLRQIFIEGNTKVLKAINSIFDPIKLANEDRIIGVVIQTKRQF